MASRAMLRLSELSRELQRGYRPRSALRRLARTTLERVLHTADPGNWRGFLQWAPAVQQMHNVPLYRQCLQLFSVAARYGFTAEEYYRYRMYRFSNNDAGGFFPLGRNIAVRTLLYRRLGLDAAPLADKRRFYRSCLDAGLPVPTTIADFEAGTAHWWNQPGFPGRDLFVKEAASLGGAGAAAWRFEPATRTWSNRSGPGLDRLAFEHRLHEASRRAPLLLQWCVRNHRDLAELGRSGLCTVRVVTLRSSASAPPSILHAVFRMPGPDREADNFVLGGLAAPIDLHTGALGPAVLKNVEETCIDMSRHPQSGSPIEGRRLPHWKNVEGLALAAHDKFPAFPSVGWDIAITPSGPMLIEGNSNWDVVLSQQVGSRPLGSTEYPEHVLSWLGEM